MIAHREIAAPRRPKFEEDGIGKRPHLIDLCADGLAQGVAALKAGKQIRYVGPGGPTSFDAYHDSPGIFQIDTYSPTGAVQVSGNITAAQLRAVSG